MSKAPREEETEGDRVLQWDVAERERALMGQGWNGKAAGTGEGRKRAECSSSRTPPPNVTCFGRKEVELGGRGGGGPGKALQS